MPSLGQVRIELQSSIDKGRGDFDIMDNICKRETSPGQCNRVIPAQLRRTPSQPRGFGSLLHAVHYPMTSLTPNVAPGGHSIGRGKIRVEFNGFTEQPQRFVVALFRPRMKARYPSQKIVVCIKAFSWLVLRTLDLGLFHSRGDRRHNTCGHLVLQLKDILQRSVEAICPEMRSRGCIDELCRNTHPVRGLAHAAFEHVPHPKFTSDLLYIDRPTLVGDARIARDHE